MTEAPEVPLILAVDDEPANLALLKKLVTRLGYRVAEASDGPGAIEAVALLQPDLILLDVLIPGLDGFEVCRRIRAQPQFAGLPILLLTALTAPEDKALGLNAGANDFLAKPFDEIELIARVRSLLRTKALQDLLQDMLGRYVSDVVAQRIIRDPVGARRLGGDRRRVSSLFADLRGYTALAESHPVEDMLELLNCYLKVATEIVVAHEGVADLLGDGVFAFFGAPVLHSDDPHRAVGAAFDIKTAVASLEIPRLPGIRLQIGAGITTGEVMAGNIGSERRMHYTVVGDAVNIAARLETAAGPGQVLVDAPTYGAVRDHVVAQDLGTLRLAGKSDWIQAFSIVELIRRPMADVDH